MRRRTGAQHPSARTARAPTQPVVRITGYAQLVKSADKPLDGVDFIVSEPFLLENLREAVEKTTAANHDGAKS